VRSSVLIQPSSLSAIQAWFSLKYLLNCSHFPSTQAQVKQIQGELDKLLSKGPKRPKETLSGLDEKIA
jgi:hypothetical protein